MDWMQLYFKLKIIVPITVWAIVLLGLAAFFGWYALLDAKRWWKKKRKKC